MDAAMLTDMDIIFVILIVLLLGGGLGWHYWGPGPAAGVPVAGPNNVLGIILTIVLVLVLLNYLGPHFHYW